MSRTRCRGWLLVRLAGRLAPDEQAAAQRHLALCTQCGPQLAAERRARRAAAAGASVAVSGAGAGTGVSLLTGAAATTAAKAGIALAIGAVATAGGVAAVDDAVSSPAHRQPAQVQQATSDAAPALDGEVPRATPTPLAPSLAPSSVPGAVPSVPSVTPTASPQPATGQLAQTLDVPLTSDGGSVPALPTVPDILPSVPVLPSALPSALLSPLPLPSPSLDPLLGVVGGVLNGLGS